MTGSWPGGLHHHGMHEFIVREAEVGTRAALAEDEDSYMGADFRLLAADVPDDVAEDVADVAERGTGTDDMERWLVSPEVLAEVRAAIAVVEAAPVVGADAQAHDRWFRSLATPEQVQQRDQLLAAAEQAKEDAMARGDQSAFDGADADWWEACWQMPVPAHQDHDQSTDAEGDLWC